MPKFTLCPHFLVNYAYDNPLEIEQKIIKPLLDCLTQAQNLGIELVLATEILRYYEESYPWNKMSDPKWTGYIRDWHLLITTHLHKANFVSVNDVHLSKENRNCAIISTKIKQLFNQFLSVFGSAKMPNKNHDEAIFIADQCHYPSTFQRYYLFQVPDHLDKVEYPWLRIYKKPLPPKGDFPFIPPNDWRKYTAPKRSISHAYVDKQGNEWKWDQLHNNHWDVQFPNAKSYKNVTPNGRILSKKKAS